MKIIIILLFVLSSFIQANEIEKVSVQLKWKYQFQFAGFIAAKEKGFYKDVGLDVELLEYTQKTDTIQDMINGKIQFAVSDSALMLEALKGIPITAMMAIYEQSPYVLMSLKSSNIKTLKDIDGKRVSIYDDVNGNAIKSMLKINNINFIQKTIDNKLKKLKNKEIDLAISYISNEPYVAQEMGMDIRTLNLSDDGFERYGDILFTLKNTVKNNPILVEKMKRATKKGFEYAFTHIDEMIEIIKSKYNTLNKSKDALRYEANTLYKMSEFGDNYGELNQAKVESIAYIYSYSEKVKYDKNNLKEFIYKPTSKLSMTKEEKEWLESNPISKVAVMNYWPQDDKGNSLHTEMLKLINKYGGTNIMPIKFNVWSDGYNKATSGKIDGIMGLSLSKQREKEHFFYTPAYDFTPCYLIVRKQNTSIKSLVDLDNRTVYLKENSITHKLIDDIADSIKVIDKKTIESMYESLFKTQEADAIVSYFIDETLLDKYNLKLVKIVYEKYGEVSIGINHQYPQLASIINKAYKSIPKIELSKLREREWNNNIKYKDLVLKISEKKWLDKKEVIQYAYDPNWKPFEWTDDLGNHQGIISDFIKLIEEKSGIILKPINTKSWSESVSKVVKKELDMFSGIGETTQRLKYLNFTDKSLYSTPYVLVSRQGENYLDGLYKSNARVGVLKDSTIKGIIQENRPNLKPLSIHSVKIAFDKLLNKELDIFIINATTAKYYINILGYDKLKIAFKTKEKLDLKIAIRKDIPIEVLSIINKAIDTISKKEISDIIYKWTEIKVQKETDWIFIGKIFIFVLILILFILWNNRKLQKLVSVKTEDIEIKKRELEYLLSSFDKNVIASRTDPLGKIIYVSEAFCKISGYSSDELIGKKHNIIQHKDTKKELYEDLWKTITSGKVWKGEIKNLNKNGSFYWVYVVITPEFDGEGKLHSYSAIREDISSKKEVEDLTVHLEDKIKEKTKNLNKQLRIVTMGERKQIELLTEVKKTSKELANAKKEIETTYKHTRDSIEYAALIQGAILPDEKLMDYYFKDFFVHWVPKDTVGGDIWLFNELRHEDECLLFFIDCTGHGVSGAFVTMIVKAIEREVVTKIIDNPIMDVSPAWIMSYFNRTMKILLKQETKDSKSNAGWDGGIIYYNRRTQILKFAGAETPLFYTDSEKILHTIKGNRYSVGYKKCDANYLYKETIINVQEGMNFYCTTDGFIDQTGGTKDFSFGKRRFENIIKENYTKSMEEQKRIFVQTMTEYENMVEDNDRKDDITVIAFEL